MSSALIRRHVLEYHTRRFKKEIKKDRRKANFGLKTLNKTKVALKDRSFSNNNNNDNDNDNDNDNNNNNNNNNSSSGFKITNMDVMHLKRKKLIGKKMRQLLDKQKYEIKSYHRKLALNLRDNVKALKILRVQPSMKQVWQERIHLIKQAHKAMGK